MALVDDEAATSTRLSTTSSAEPPGPQFDAIDELIRENTQSKINEMYLDIENDVRVGLTFKHRITWYWPYYAKYLVLLSMPTFDTLENKADLDWKVLKYFEGILGEGSVGMACCTLGHNGNRFQIIPTLKEFMITAPWLNKFILNTNPNCIFSVDTYPSEALRCDLDPHIMYLSRNVYGIEDVVMTQLSKGVDLGELKRTNLHGGGCFRYITLSRFSTKGKGFKAAIMTHRDNLDNLHAYNVKATPIKIYDYPYNFSKKHASRYLNNVAFLNEFLHDHRYDKYQLRANIINLPRSVRYPEHVFLSSIQYDYNTNIMRCFCSTPEGLPYLINLEKIPFVFGFTPHAAFSMDPSNPAGGNFAGMADHLTEADLHLLHKEMCNKLRWVFKYQKKDISQDIKLWITKAHNHGESCFYTLRSIIMCKVTTYALVKPITQLLERLIRNWPNKDQDFKPVESCSPEQMFSYTYTIKVCHWYRIRHPEGHQPFLQSTDGHVRQIECNMEFNEDSMPIILMNPKLNEIVGPQRTTNAMPPHVQISMDIECVDIKGHFPDPWQNPIICICNTVWRKENLTVEVDNKKFRPLKGYLYVTFNLGVSNPENTHKSLMDGETIHYYFDNEADMLIAYGQWLHYMIPDYFMGHNFKAFDINYIVQRAATLNIILAPLGRINQEVIRIDRYKMSTRAFGDRYITSVKGMSGCCLLDFLEILLRDFKLASNTLDYAGSEMLGATKLVMPYNALKGNWMKSPETFQKVIDYCNVDAMLVDQLINKNESVNKANALSRVTGTVTPSQLWELGMQIKVFSTIAHIAKLRPPHYKVLFPTPDSWSYQYNDIIVERHMVKHMDFENEEKQNAGPKGDEIIWRPTINGRKRPSRGDYITEEEIQEKLNNDRYVQGTIGEDGGYIDEETLKRQSKRKNVSADQTFEDFDKILREIKLNGGREGPVTTAPKSSYTGAVVLDAPLGMYFDIPYLCMDFSGLYPSIIMAYNIGGDTLIFESERIARNIPLDMVNTPPDCTERNPRTGKIEIYHFVKKEIWPSVIAESEEFLKAARSEAKRKMNAADDAGDDNLKSIYDALQNNFKLIMNSIYGALGVSRGPIACKAAAKAVTAWGRYWILEMNRVCDTLFNARLAGGDTDSIFKGFPGKMINGKLRHRIRNREEGELFGPWLTKTILNPLLPQPMSLEYEKMMFYLLTIAKKRYNYIHIELRKDPKISAKGMETVRRDTTKFTKITLKQLQNQLLVMPSPELQKLLYPKPCKANPFTYYTRYQHYVYTEKGLKFRPPEDYVMQPLDEEHAVAMQKWTSLSTPEAQRKHLQALVAQWRKDEETYFSTQANKLKTEKEKMVEYVRQRARVLVNGHVPLTECVQSKQRSREHYKSEAQPHLTVIKNKEMRGEDVPQIGERVRFAYRILPDDPNGKGKLRARKAYLCADDPVRIIRENQPVNWPFYLHNTFVKPVVRYMRWVLKEEMIARIRERRDREKKRHTGFFVPVTKTLTGTSAPSSSSSSDESPLGAEKEITLEEITNETTQYLFMTLHLKTTAVTDLYAEYAKLIDTKKPVLPHTDKHISPIAQFRDKTDEDLRRVLVRHDKDPTNYSLTDIEDLFSKMSFNEGNCQSVYNACLKTCQNCLGEDVVECENIDCPEFLPRISAEVDLDKVMHDKDVIKLTRLKLLDLANRRNDPQA